MDWLIPALIATSSMAILIAMVYLFLYYQEKEKFLVLWSICWAVYSLRFIIHTCIILNIVPPSFVVFQQFASLVSALIFILGTYIFLNKPFQKFWLYGTVLSIIWAIFSENYSLSFVASHIPVAFFIGSIFCWTGYSLIKTQFIEGYGKHIAGWALILWGIHKADYPFLRPVLWFAPWGYLLASTLFLLSAIGILLVYYEKVRANLKSELQIGKKMSEALAESKLLLDNVVEGATDAIFLKDTEGKYLLVNEATCKAIGRPKEDIIGKNDKELFPESSAQVINAIDSSVLTSGKTRNAEERIETTYGDSFWLTNKTPYRDSNGKIIGLIGISRNVTDIKNFEKEKRNLEIRLNQAQKMESIGTLAGGIAHDFNNILYTILGYTELAKEDAPQGTLFEENLENVLIAANRAKDLVKQILAFSRQSQVERIPVNIQPLIKEGLKMLRSSIPTTISITEDIEPLRETILADPTQIHQILMNLCTNAYHAMEETGGVLSVTLKITFIKPDDQKILMPVPSGEYVHLIVADSGVGIGPDAIEKIFDPYFTTKETGKGTGMGLAIIHGIIKKYRGAITVESQLGKGSTFHVYFPVMKEDPSHEIKESEFIPTGKERVLFIDDEEMLAELGKSMLERLGYHVTVRLSSVEALTTFQNTPNEFDVVITDQTMPDMTGYDLARRMLQIRPDVPIILCTGYSSLIDERSAKVIGIKEFALKPLTKKLIAKLIRKVIDGAG